MKKRISALLVFAAMTFLTACELTETTLDEPLIDSKTLQGTGFDVKSEHDLIGADRMYVVVDAETGVEYLVYYNIKGVSMTPRLDKNRAVIVNDIPK